MNEHQNQHGKWEEPKGTSRISVWWAQHRAWVAGLDRKAKIRYRLFQALVVIAVVIIAVALFLRAWIRLPDVPDPPDPSNLVNMGDGSQSGAVSGSLEYEGAELPEVTKSGRKEGYYTFLLVGRDTSTGLTDTMMLITYDTKDKKISAISLLRDTMINTSGKSGGQKRLNAVFNRNLGSQTLSDKERITNGMAALRLEVSRLTGIYPDFYVMVEWEAIGRLVDAVGGVEFEVPFDMDYDDKYQDLYIHQKAGLRLLDGQDAMEVIRFRKNNDGSNSLGDVGRTQIQRDFLTAVLKKCLTPEILLKVPTLAQIFMENVDTDLTVGNILAFAQLAVGMDADQNVNFYSLPCYGVMYDGASLVCATQSELLEIINNGINPYLDDVQASDLQLMYKKSGGGFGVTNGTLADPAVAVAAAPKPADPVEKDPEETEDPEDPDTAADPGTDTDPGTTADPGTATDPGTDTSPGTDTDPGTTPDPGTAADPTDISAIDPSTIFPDPSPDIWSGSKPDTTQAAA